MCKVRSDIVTVRTDHDGVPVYGNGIAKVVVSRSVYRYQLLLLSPSCSRTHVHIRRALIGICPLIVLIRPNNGSLAADSDRVSKNIAGGSVRSDESLLLRPVRTGADEDISRTLIANRPVVVCIGTDDRCVSRKSDALAEEIVRRRIRRG